MNRAIWGHPFTNDAEGGWTLRRLEVIKDAAGVCVRCGFAGADTAIRGWDHDELVAAHTRCVVGLGPPVTAGSPRLRAA